jgi:small subunit ribosomal protein S8
MRVALAETLKEAGYVDDFSVADIGNNKKELTITLKYKGKQQTPVIEGLRRISKPSCRVYVNSNEIPRVLGGLGIAILTTSSGLLTDREARKRNVGGELLCYVW